VQQAASRGAWPCAVVCDYRLSNSYNGFDAIAELRYEFGDDLPAILVTGDLDPQIQVRAEQHGIRVMHKPIDQEQLLRALHDSTHSG